MQFEKHFVLHLRFDLFARVGANALEHLAAFADDNAFVILALDVDDGSDVCRFVRRFVKLIDLHKNSVRHFFAQKFQRRFTNQFGGELAQVKIGDLIVVVVFGTFGQTGNDHRQKFVVDVVAAHGRDQHPLGGGEKRTVGVGIPHHLIRFEAITFVES